MSNLLVPVIYGSVRTERQGIKAARFILNELANRGIDGVLVDPLEKQLPLLDLRYSDYEAGTAPAVLEELADLYRRADGFLIVSGEYNHGIPPALKNLLDHFLDEYQWRPSGIACYSSGQFGGVRAAMSLRMCLAQMGMVTIPTLLPFPRVQDAFDDQGVPSNPKTASYSATFFDEFVWYMNALRAARAQGVPT